MRRGDGWVGDFGIMSRKKAQAWCKKITAGPGLAAEAVEYDYGVDGCGYGHYYVSVTDEDGFCFDALQASDEVVKFIKEHRKE